MIWAGQPYNAGGKEMFSIKSVRNNVVTLSIAGTIALASVMGPGMASADGSGRDSNLSFESAS